MDIASSKIWKEWVVIQGHGPTKKWDKLVAAEVYNNDKAGLKQAFSDYLKVYAKDPQVKDRMIASIQTKLRKPMMEWVHDHYNRLDLLMDYINLLPGGRT